MRAGPLSEPRVTQLLNEYFVPIHLSNGDYYDPKLTPDDERSRYEKIFETARARGLPTGLVHVYLFASDGQLSTSMHVAEALKPDVLHRFLHEQIRLHNAQRGPTLQAPRPQLVHPPTHDGELLLHSVVRVAGGNASWPGIAEDIVHLSRAEWQQLVESNTPESAGPWDVSPEIAQQIFTHIYPPTFAYDTEVHQFYRSRLTSRILSEKNGERLVALDGEMSMDHAATHTEMKLVHAVVTGYARYQVGSSQPPEVRMSTFSATYGDGRFDHVAYTDPPSQPKAVAPRP